METMFLPLSTQRQKQRQLLTNLTIKMVEAMERVKRSVKLTQTEHEAFKAKIGEFDTKRDAAEFFGFSTVTLDNIDLKGSCKPSTRTIIREKLQLVAA